MHPLLDGLTFIKAKLVRQHSREFTGALDVYSLPNDMQIYASAKFLKLVCVALTVSDNKQLRENAPSKPLSVVAPWELRSRSGRRFLHSTLDLAHVKLSCSWINLHRTRLTREAFEELVSSIHTHSEDGGSLFVICVDGDIARQFARAHQIYINRDNEMLMGYHKQRIDNLTIEEISAAAEQAGFVLRSCTQGDSLLQSHGINAAPYDLWTSQTFFLMHFQSRLHFLKPS